MSFPHSKDKYKPGEDPQLAALTKDPADVDAPPEPVLSDRTKAEMAEGKKNAEINAAKFAAVEKLRAEEQEARDEADAEAKAAADEAKRLKMG